MQEIMEEKVETKSAWSFDRLLFTVAGAMALAIGIFAIVAYFLGWANVAMFLMGGAGITYTIVGPILIITGIKDEV